MARKPHVIPNQQRDARQLLIKAAPLVSHYSVEEVGIALTFADPEGKQTSSPRGMTFTSDMHAFFQFSCPMRDCVGGGFDANADLQKALGRHRAGHTGSLTCTGVRPRGGVKNAPCNIKLNYTLEIRAAKTGAAA